jgi:hypothetical protein
VACASKPALGYGDGGVLEHGDHLRVAPVLAVRDDLGGLFVVENLQRPHPPDLEVAGAHDAHEALVGRR